MGTYYATVIKEIFNSTFGMFGLSTKSSLVLGLAIILGVWVSRKGPSQRDYWEKLPRFNDVLPNFKTPQPMDQSLLFKTANEIVDPILAQPSGKIPKWLKGKLVYLYLL